MPIKKRQLLRAMGGIIGRIQIDGDPPSPAVQPFPMSLDHHVGQCFGHAKQLFTTHTHTIFFPARLRLPVECLERINNTNLP